MIVQNTSYRLVCGFLTAINLSRAYIEIISA